MDLLPAIVLCLGIFVIYNGQASGTFSVVCGVGEEYDMCRSPCEQTCDSVRKSISFACSRPCVPGCFCKIGYVRANDNTCVLPEDCFRPSNPQCPRNEVYVRCVNFCNSCFRSEYCRTDYCVSGCDCKVGYYRNSDGYCVNAEQCAIEFYRFQQQCGVNEVYTSCTNPCNDCFSKGRCEYLKNSYCNAGCDCKLGYFRNEKGVCVPEWNCYSQCNEDEIYLECGPSCRSTCENYRGLFGHPCKQQCASGCFCRGNLVVGPGGKCIPPEYCPAERQPTCPPGEQYYQCAPTCRNTCETYFDPNMFCDTSCSSGCFCKVGLVRRRDGACVLPKDCTENIPHRCPAGEVFYQCLPTCRTTCRSLFSTNGVCTTECKAGCFCQEGFVRNDDGKCVPPSQCPVPRKTCPPGEIHYDCVPICRNTCDNLNSTEPCPLICRSGCFCKIGFVRRRDGVCVQPRHCPIVCGPNEEFRSCGSACPPTCENRQTQACTQQCARGCFCKAGFVLGPKKKCIPPRQCPISITTPSSTTVKSSSRTDDDDDDDDDWADETRLPISSTTTTTMVMNGTGNDNSNVSVSGSEKPTTMQNPTTSSAISTTSSTTGVATSTSSSTSTINSGNSSTSSASSATSTASSTTSGTTKKRIQSDTTSTKTDNNTTSTATTQSTNLPPTEKSSTTTLLQNSSVNKTQITSPTTDTTEISSANATSEKVKSTEVMTSSNSQSLTTVNSTTTP